MAEIEITFPGAYIWITKSITSLYNYTLLQISMTSPAVSPAPHSTALAAAAAQYPGQSHPMQAVMLSLGIL